MKLKNIEWLAGLLEGEGTFTIQTTPQIIIQMVDKDIIDRVAEIFSRPVYTYQTTQNNKKLWKTSLYGDDALELMRLLLPHMGLRRTKQIKKVFGKAKKRPGQVRLRPEYISWIQKLGDSGAPHTLAAKIFGISNRAIGRIVRRQTWKNVR